MQKVTMSIHRCSSCDQSKKTKENYKIIKTNRSQKGIRYVLMPSVFDPIVFFLSSWLDLLIASIGLTLFGDLYQSY